MDAEFSESSFASAYIHELRIRWRGHLLGPPELPSTADEGRGRKGYDARIDSSKGFVYLAQFKLSEYMIRDYCIHAKHFPPPHYRFKITGSKRSYQHRDLLSFEDKSHPDYYDWWYGPRRSPLHVDIAMGLQTQRSSEREGLISRLQEDELNRIASLLDEHDDSQVNQWLHHAPEPYFQELISSIGRKPNSFTRHHLLSSELSSSADTLVEYVAPRFHLYDELVVYDGFSLIPERSLRVRPSDIGPIDDGRDHYVVFDENGTRKTLFSEPRELPDTCDWGEITDGGFSGYPNDEMDEPSTSLENDADGDRRSSLRSIARGLVDRMETTFDARRTLFGDDEVEQAHGMARFLLGAELLIFLNDQRQA